MITVIIYGLDQFVVGDLSKEMTPLLAKNYEVDADEINFVAPNNMVFHAGVEQTSWNVLVHVHAPKKVSVLEEQATKIIIALLKQLSIHIVIEFYYYSQDNRHTFINPDYPRFLEENNDSEYDNYESEEISEGEEEDQIYTGDIFEGHKEELDKHCDCNCEEEDEHHCDCDCECHKH